MNIVTSDLFLMQMRNKWKIDQHEMIPHPVRQEEYQQTLAEIAEVLYKSMCQPSKKTKTEAQTESQPLIAKSDQKERTK